MDLGYEDGFAPARVAVLRSVGYETLEASVDSSSTPSFDKLRMRA